MQTNNNFGNKPVYTFGDRIKIIVPFKNLGNQKVFKQN